MSSFKVGDTPVDIEPRANFGDWLAPEERHAIAHDVINLCLTHIMLRSLTRTQKASIRTIICWHTDRLTFRMPSQTTA